MPKHFPYTVVLLSMLIAPSTFAASFTLTDKAFFNSGADAFIGQVVDVQVMSTTQTFETGTVLLNVAKVVAGNITTQSITLPYQRALVPSDEESNWDLVEPAYVSLKTAALGKDFLIFVSENNGTYLLSPASNAVQDASRGLLLGRIEELHDDSTHHTGEVRFEIDEMIFGWIDGTDVTMQIDKEHPCKQNNDSNRAMPLVGGFDDRSNYQDKEVIVALNNRGVCGIEIASNRFLELLTAADSK